MDINKIIRAIKDRHSVRTFVKRPIADDIISSLQKFISDNTDTPFGGEYAIRLASVTLDGDSFKPSTYGVIRNATTYLLLGYGDTPDDALSAGYAGEKIVLEAKALGIDTCWIAATFRDSTFESVARFDRSTPLKIVIAMGYAASRRSLLDSLTHTIARSSSRKPFDILFTDTSTGCAPEQSSAYYEPLQLLRRAPSAMNSQNWRAMLSDGRADFYTIATDMTAYVNMGIALSHFAIGCRAEGIDGKFKKIAAAAQTEGLSYVTSYQSES